jgi:predicted metal-dependent enzyme (double-stranded beta helix superfamily)
MAPDTLKEQDSMKNFVAQVRSIWGDGKDPTLPLKVKGLLEKLLSSANPEERWIVQLIRDGLPTRKLYRDEDHGFILMGHVHEKGYCIPPHDHGPCWVLYGVYHGVTEITTYLRTDDGKVPERATLKKKELNRATPGVVISYLPGEIHSTFAVEHSVVFRFLSYDLDRMRRSVYDLEKGTVQHVYGRCYLPC